MTYYNDITITDENEEVTNRWLWCMNWCKKQGLAPADSYAWTSANNAYTKLIKKHEVIL